MPKPSVRKVNSSKFKVSSKNNSTNYQLPTQDYIKIGQASKTLGVSIDTLRRWEKVGKIKTLRTSGGTRLYSLSQLEKGIEKPTANVEPASQTTEELLKKVKSEDAGWVKPEQNYQNSADYLSSNLNSHPLTPSSEVSSKLFTKHLLTNKFLLGTGTLIITTMLVFGSNFSGIVKPKKPPAISSELQNIDPNVLAVTASSRFLEVNSDTQINGSLSVRDTINNLTLEATPSASTIALTSGGTTLNITNSSTIDQDLSTSSSPTFDTLNLSGTSNQLVFQSEGSTGTLTWTPTATRVITLPDATTTLVGTNTTQTLTNKTISGSSNTLSNIPNSALSNSAITVSAGTNLTGGGSVSLGGSTTVALKDSISLAGTLDVTGNTALASALTVTGNVGIGTSTAPTNLKLGISGNVGIGTSYANSAGPANGLIVEGNVGIGTSAPAEALDVSGNLRLSGTTTFGGLAYTWPSSQTINGFLQTDGSGTLTWQTVSVSGAAAWSDEGAFVRLTTPSDSVGIGTTASVSLGSKLVVAGNIGVGISYTTATTPTNGLAIEGNVGIGTTTANSSLSVSGNAHIGTIRQGISAPANGLLVDGNVGVGGTSAAYNLDIWGSGRFTSTLTVDGNLGVGQSANISSLLNTANLNVSGTSSLGTGYASSLTVSGNTALGSSLTVNSAAALNTVNVSGISNLVGNVGIGNSLTVVGNGNFGSLTSSTSSLGTAYGSTLTVSGNVGFGSSLNINAANALINTTGLKVSGFSDLTNTGITGTLNVSGNTGLGSSLTVTSASILDSLSVTKSISGATLGISGNTGIGASLNIAGLTFAQGGLRVNGYSDLTGNVGVGTSLTAPFAYINALRVDSCQGCSAPDAISGAGVSGGVTFFDGTQTVTSDVSQFYFDNANNRLGIGTSSPGGALVIQTGNVGIGISAPSQTFQVNSGANSIVITSNGNLGVGTTSPSFPLHVLGNVGIGTSLTVASLANLGGLNVSGASSLGTAYASTLTVSGNTGIGSSLSVNSAAALTTLNVSGISNLVGNVGIGASLNVNSADSLINATNLNVSGTSVLGTGYASGLTVSGNIGVGSSLTVNSAAALTTLNVSGISNLVGNVGIGASLTVVGQGSFGSLSSSNSSLGTAFASGLTVSGNTGVGASISVVSNGNFGSLTSSTSSLGTAYASSLISSGNIGVGLSLNVNSTNSLVNATNLNVSGTSSLGTAYASTLTVSGNTGIGSSLSVNSAAALTTLNVSGISNFAGNVGLGASLNVAGLTSLNGGLRLNVGSDTTGDIYYRGSSGEIVRLPIGTSGFALASVNGLPAWTSTESFTSAGGWVDAGAYLRLLTMGDNVGIGTTASQDPIGKLHLRGNGDSTGITLVTTNNANTQFGLTVLDNGNVGIATTNPDYNLRVNGTGYFSGFVGIGSSLSVSGNVGINTSLSVTSASALTTLNVSSTSSLVGNVGIGASLNVGGLTFSQGGLRVTGFSDLTGNVGVGGTLTALGPTRLNGLSLTLGSDATGDIYYRDSTGLIRRLPIGASGQVLSVSSGIPNWSETNSFTAAAGWFDAGGYIRLQDAGDNVGIGTTISYDPLAKFHIEGEGASTGLTFFTTDSNRVQRFAILDNGNVGIGTTAPGGSLVVTTGNVGIGTSVPNAKLSIQGNVGIGYTALSQVIPTNGLAVAGNVGVGITTANSTLSVSGNAHIGSIRQGITAPTDGLIVDGNVGIGNTTSDNKLDVWGNARITGSLTVDGAFTSQGSVTPAGQFLAIDGTPSAPGYSFANDTNTGLYRYGTDSIALITGGPSGNLLSLNSNGNVGIGTTSPDYKLRVEGIGYFTSFVGIGSSLDVSGNVGIGSSLSVTSAAALTTLNVSGISNLAGNVGIGASLTNNVTNGLISTAGLNVTGGSSLGTAYASSLVSSGNIGVGLSLNVNSTNSLVNATNLNVSGTSVLGTAYASGLTLSGQLKAADGTATAPGISFDADTNTGLYRVGADAISLIVGGPTGGSLLSLNTTGVGIGTTSPTQKLQVNGNDSRTFVVTSSGNVGIGFTTPTSLLHIQGDGSTGSWRTNSNALPAVRVRHSSAAANGYVYVLGGANGNWDQQSTVFYAKLNSDGSTGSWTTNSNYLPGARMWGSSVTNNGYLYFLGGGGSNTVYYAKLNSDGSTGIFTTNSNNLPAAREGHTTVSANGYVYVIAGTLNDSGSNTQSTVFYAKLNSDGSTGTWTTNVNYLPNRLRFASSVSANGYVYVLGGFNSGDAEVSTAYYAKLNSDGSTGAWTTNINYLPNIIRGLTTIVANGYIYAIGGENGGFYSTVYYARLNSDGSVGTWNTNSNYLPQARDIHSSVVANGHVYVLGGYNGSHQATVYYAPLQRVSLQGNLDLLGLSGANVGDSTGDSSQGSVGGSIYAGNIFSAGALEVSGNAQFWNGLSTYGPLSIGTSSPASSPLFTITNTNSTNPLNTLFTLMASGNLGLGVTNPAASFLIGSGNVGIAATSAAYNLDVWGTGRFTSGLTIGGNLGLGGSLTISGLTYAQGGLTVSGFSDLTGNVGVGASLNVVGTNGIVNTRNLNVVGISTLTGNVGVGASLNVVGNGNFGSLTSSTSSLGTAYAGSLTVSGNIGTGSSLSVVSASALSTLNVSGISNLVGNVGIGSSLTVVGHGAFGSISSSNSSLGTAFASGLTVSGNTGIGSSLSVTGLSYALGGLRVNGFSDLTGNVGIGGSLNVTSLSTFSSHILPSVDDTYDLGSNSFRWRDLYLGPGTLHVGTSLSDEYTISYDTTSNYLGFNVNGSGGNEIVFDSNGNIGIGITNPSASVHIVQTAAANAFRVDDGANDTTPFIIDQNGNVGINTETAGVALEVRSSNPLIRLYRDGGALHYTQIDTNDGNSADFATNYGFLTLSVAPSDNGTPTERFRLTQSGNIGIASSNPGAKLHVGANALIGFGEGISAPALGLAVSGNVGIGITTANSTLSVSGNAHIGSLRQGVAAPTDGLLVDGNVGIGATSTAYNLDVWGTGRFSGVVTVAGNLGIGTSLTVDSASALTTLNVSGISNLTGNVGIGASLSVVSHGAFGSISSTNSSLGTAYASGLTISGNTGIGSSLSVTSASALSTLNVSGISNLVGNVGIGASLNVVGNGNFGSLSSSNSSLGTAYASGLTVSGNTGIGSSLSVTGLSYALGGLRVNGYSDLTGNVGVGGSLTTYSAVSFNSLSSQTGTALCISSTNQIVTCATGSAVSGSGSSGQVSFWNGAGSITGTNSFFFDSVNNRLGIGSSTAGSTLGVFGSVGIGSSYGYFSAPANGLIVEGNVGVGTTSPDYPLHVIGNVGIGASAIVNGNIYTPLGLRVGGFSDLAGNVGVGGSINVVAANGLVNTINLNVSGTSVLGTAYLSSLTSSGNVSVGSSLTVVSGTSLSSSLSVSGHSSLSTLSTTGASTFNGGLTIAGVPLDITTGINETLTIIPNGTGNVGIGTSDTYGRLHLLGAGTGTGINFQTVSSRGVQGLTVLDNGNVGVGTTAPGSLFVVNGPAVSNTTIANFRSTNNSTVFTINTSNGIALSALGNCNGSICTAMVLGLTGAINISSETVPVQINAPTYTITGSYANQRITRFTQPTITAASSLGITTEANTVNIAGAPISAGSATIANSIGLRISSGTSIASGVNAGYGLYVDAPTGALNNFSAVFMGGNVGIGTTLPNSTLSIQGNLGIGYTGVNQIIPTNGLAVSGNVGIGITTANSTLSVSGNAHIGSLRQGISAPTDGLFVDGNTGIGATSTAYNLDVWGTGRFTSGLTIGGNLGLGGSLTISGLTYAQGGLTVSGFSDLTGNVGVGASLNVVGTNGIVNTRNLNVVGTSVLGTAFAGSLTSSGNVGIGSSLSVTSASALSTLNVSGISNLVGNVGVGASLTVVGHGAFGSISSSNSSLGTAYASGLTVSGNAGIGSSLSVTGLTYALGGLRVNGYSDLTGNVGIGGSLNVTSLSQFSSHLIPTSDDSFDLGGNSNRFRDLYLGPGTLHLGTSIADEYTLTYDTTANSLGFNVNGSGANEVVFDANGNVGIGFTSPLFLFQVNSGANTTFINSSGNIGIGATTSTNKLDVWGNSRITGALTVDGSITVGSCSGCAGSSFLAGDGTPTNPAFSFTSDTNTGLYRVGTDSLALVTGGPSANLLSLNTTGVGVGTTSPTQKFQVNEPGLNTFVVTSGGNVGVGTSAPTAKLDLIGNIGTGTTNYTLIQAQGDGGTGIWKTNNNYLPGLRAYASSVVANGYVYVIGGTTGTTQSTVYYAKLNSDGSTGSWTTNTNYLPVVDQEHVSVTANGYVYVMGGIGGSPLDELSTVYYAKLNSDGSVGTFTTNSNYLLGARRGPASAVANGYVYVMGGNDADGTAHSTVYYAKLNSDGSTGTWNTNVNYLPGIRYLPTSIVANGYIYVIGGMGAASARQSTVYYAKLNSDGSTGTWTTNANYLPEVRVAPTPIITNGYLYVMGGLGAANGTSTVYYAKLNADGSVGSWTTNTNYLLAARSEQTSVVANGYVYALGGGTTSASATAQSTVFYAPLQRVSIQGNLDLLGLSGANVGDSTGDSSFGSVGGTIYAGNIFSAGALEVSGNSQFWNGLSVNGGVNIGVGASSPATGSAFSISGNTTLGGLNTPLFNVLNNGNVGIGVSSADYKLRVDGTGFFSGFVGIGSSLNVSGNVGIGQSLSVTSASALSTLNVTGISNLVGNVGVGASLTVVGHGAFGSISSTNSSLGTAFGSTLTVSGNVGFGTSLTVTGTNAAIAATNLNVSGTSSLGTAYASGLTLSGQLKAADGTATAPGYSFDADTNTGLYRVGTDAISLIVGGPTNADLLSLNTTGVGIGTTSPTQQLQVNGNDSRTFVVTNTGNVGIGFTTPNSLLHIQGNGDIGTWKTNSPSMPAGLYGPSSVVSNGYVYVVGGREVSSNLDQSTVYYAKINSDGSVGTWITNTNYLPQRKAAHSSAVANGFIYAIAGSVDAAQATIYYAKLNSDGSTGAWTTNSNSLPAADRSRSAVIANGYIYVNVRSNNNIFYGKLNADGSIGTFTTSSNPIPLSISPSLITANGYLYAVGDYTDNGSQSTVFYAKINSDGSTGTWTTNGNYLPVRVGGSHTTSVANGYLYVVGGTDIAGAAVSTVYYAKIKSDGSTESWTTRYLPERRYASASVIANGFLYIIGGHTGATYASTIYYSSLQRVSIQGNLDLLGLSGANVGDSTGNSSFGSVGGSIYAGNIFSAGALEVSGNSQFWQGAGFNGPVSIGVGASSPATGLAFSIGGNTTLGGLNTPMFTVLNNGNVGIGPSTPGAALNVTSGNVGIGGTSAAYNLDVWGTGRFTGALTLAGNLGLGGSITSANLINTQGLNVSGASSLGTAFASTLTVSGNVGLGTSLTVTGTNATIAASNLNVSGTSSLGTAFGSTLTVSGNVGFGTSLTVTGTNAVISASGLRVSGFTDLTGNLGVGTSLNVVGTNGLTFTRNLSVSGISTLTGNVGIGASLSLTGSNALINTIGLNVSDAAVINKLFVTTCTGCVGTTLTIGDGTATAPAYSFSADTNTGLYRVGTDSLALIAGGPTNADLLSLDTTGVGIGTTSPTQQLQVNGNDSRSFVVTNTGNVGIGFTTPTSLLHIQGDGSTGSWTRNNNYLPAIRESYSSVTANGYIYILGGCAAGCGANSNLQSTVYYAKINSNGSTGSWRTNSNYLPDIRSHHTSVVANGFVYVIGGCNGGDGCGGTNIVYYAKINSDGSTGAWRTSSNKLPASKAYHSSIVSNGYAYLIGGDINGTNTVYYAKLNSDGTTGVWQTDSTTLPAVRSQQTSIAANGYVYVIGGCTASVNCSASTQSTVYYAKLNSDGTTGSWTTNANYLPGTRTFHSSIVSNGFVYVIGGENSSGALSGVQSTIYYAQINEGGSLGTWRTSSQFLLEERHLHSSVVANGYVYVIGGDASGTSSTQSTVYYAPLQRVSIQGDLDLLGLSGANVGDSTGDSSFGSVGGTIYAGNIFGAGGLEVSGNSQFWQGAGFNGPVNIGIGTSSNTNLAADTTPLLSITSSASTVASNIIFSVLAGGNVGIGASAPGSLLSIGSNVGIGISFAYKNTPVSGLAVQGNVGIGTTTANNALSVAGAINIGNALGVTAPTNGALITGNVGIGGTTAAYNLDVWGTGRFTGNLGIGGSLTVSSVGVFGAGIMPTLDDALDLGTSTLRWRDLYVGPTSLNLVCTSGECTTARNWNIGVQETAGNSEGSLRIGLATTTPANRDFLNINTSGNVGIGATTPNAPLDVWGNTRITGNLTLDGTTLSAPNVSLTVSSCTGCGGASNGQITLSPTGTGPIANITNSVTPIAAGATGSYSTLSYLPQNLYQSATIGYNGYLFIIGGRDASLAQTTIYSAQVKADGTIGAFTLLSNSLPDRRTFHQVAAYNGYLFVVGGDGPGGNRQSTVFSAPIRSDGTIGTFSTLTYLPFILDDFGIATNNGYLFISGGNSGAGGIQSTVFSAPIRSDGTIGTFSTLTYLPDDINGHAMAAYNNYLFVSGGTAGNARSTVYSAPIRSDGTIGTFSTLTYLPDDRTNPTMNAYNGYLYVTGGRDDSAALQSTVFSAPIRSDGTIGTFSTLTYLPDDRYYHSATTYNGYLFVTLGCNASCGAASTYHSTVWSTPLQSTALAVNTSSTFAQGNLLELWNNLQSKFYVDYSGNLGIQGKYVSNVSQNGDGTTGSYATTTFAPQALASLGAAAYNGYLYITGGSQNSQATRQSTVYSAQIKSDGTIGNFTTQTYYLPVAVERHSTNAYNGYLYVVGGIDSVSNGARSSVYYAQIKSDGNTGPWTLASNYLTEPVRYNQSVVYNGYLYVVGGKSGVDESTTVSYTKLNSDGSIGAFTAQDVLPEDRVFHSVVAYNGYMYVIGGGPDDNTTVAQSTVYYGPIKSDGSVGTFSFTTFLPVLSQRQYATAYNGYIYVLGGDITGTGRSAVYSAPIKSDGSLGNWSTLSNSLPAARYTHDGALYNGYIYAIGGDSGPNSTIYYTSLTTSRAFVFNATLDVPNIGIGASPGGYGSIGIGTSPGGAGGNISLWTLQKNGDAMATFNSAGDLLLKGKLSANSVVIGTDQPGDLAENFPVSDSSIEAGDVVVITPTSSLRGAEGDEVISEIAAGSTNPRNDGKLVKSSKPYDKSVVGVITTNPSITLSPDQKDGKPVALSGRTPVKVSTENGPINAGDYLTSSSIPGIAMKATKPGQVIGKALDGFNGEGGERCDVGIRCSKVLMFINVTFADPDNFFNSLIFDNDGNLVVPKIKTGKLTLDESLASSSSSLRASETSVAISTTYSMNEIASSGPEDHPRNDAVFYDLTGKIARLDALIEAQRASLEDRINQLESVNQNVSKSPADSADIAESTPSADIANKSSTESLLEELNKLDLSPAQMLLASDSAMLATSNTPGVGLDSPGVFLSDPEFSGVLTAYQAEIQDNFKVFGTTTLGKTTIAGDLNVDGTLSFENGSEINVLGTLYLQKSLLAEKLDVFNGKITIDKQGNIQTLGTITASGLSVNKLTIITSHPELDLGSVQGIASGSAQEASSSATISPTPIQSGPTIGSSKIIAGQTSVTIGTSQVSKTSKIFLTPRSKLGLQSLVVEEVTEGKQFKVSMDHPLTTDAEFDWWVIETR